MRSSKSRSRGNKNRNTNRPTGGNIINRVFDSSGPDGKVRGTPQQIIEKYNQLHRDAQLSNDRVNAENFAQHAEHYLRMLAEAQREVDRAREEQEEQNRQRQAERDRERNEQEELNRQRQAERDRERSEQEELNRQRQAERDRERNERLRAQEEASNGDASDQPRQPEAPRDGDQPRRSGRPRRNPQPQDDVQQSGDDGATNDSTLVDTPESRGDAPAPKPRKPRAPRKPRPKPEGGDTPSQTGTDGTE
ncbi:protein of unknown function [Loktanella atrilutea]|uniref:DUF4167 domain-containing protein n=1 Tax=Loktanella atrilutea TaxID=366533 RepID=A0A1M4UMG5_LOKAT|nr:DUF4167 domain-containing protein [Loktanella atrilutea]SHE57874.1 protein of unknown function [Loktanella atrilutea]